MGDDFDYKKAFESLDYAALKEDIKCWMTDPKSGGRRIMAITGRFSFAWHGTARGLTGIQDGRGGAEPEPSVLHH